MYEQVQERAADRDTSNSSRSIMFSHSEGFVFIHMFSIISPNMFGDIIIHIYNSVVYSVVLVYISCGGTVTLLWRSRVEIHLNPNS